MLHKKSIVALLCVCASSASVWGQSLVANLSHDGEQKIFYGYSAFRQAYDAATDGDAITLSGGRFEEIPSIEKSIRIIGNYAFDAEKESSFVPYLVVAADDVYVEGMRIIGDVILKNTQNALLRRCCISTLKADSTHFNTFVEDCSINKDESLKGAKKYQLKRCEINEVTENSTENLPIFENCTIYRFPYETYLTKDFGRWSARTPKMFGIFKECCIGVAIWSSNLTQFRSPSEFHSVLFLGSDSQSIEFTDSTIRGIAQKKDVNANSWNKKFGSFYHDEIKTDEMILPVGCVGHKAWPAVPRIVECNIDDESDADGKVNVHLKVQVEN